MQFKIHLKDGSAVDLHEEGGATKVLRGVGSDMKLLSSSVEHIQKIQQKNKKKKRLNASQKDQIHAFQKIFVSIPLCGRSVFRENVPESEIQCWVEFVISEFRRFATLPKWITTGTLESHDYLVLLGCMNMFYHALPVELAFKSDFFQALADLVKARKAHTGHALPSAEGTSERIAMIICNCYQTARKVFENTWPAEKTFRKLDDSGVLEEFFRCATVPSNIPKAEAAVDEAMMNFIFDELLGCLSILQKRLNPAASCGKVIREILAGNDGSTTPRPETMRWLQEIAKLVETMDQAGGGTSKDTQLECKKCGKKDALHSLMKCARCQQTYYCSKACQKADWKVHKQLCRPVDKSTEKQKAGVVDLLNMFVKDHYVDVMIKMVEECDKTGVAKKDMLVYLDYCVNEDGVVPVMQDPPVFDVVPTKLYLDRSYPFEKPEQNLPANIDVRVRAIKERYSELTTNQTLFFVSFKDGILCHNVEISNMYSDEVFEGFRATMNDADVDLLCDTLDPMVKDAVLGLLAQKMLMISGELDHDES